MRLVRWVRIVLLMSLLLAALPGVVCGGEAESDGNSETQDSAVAGFAAEDSAAADSARVETERYLLSVSHVIDVYKIAMDGAEGPHLIVEPDTQSAVGQEETLAAGEGAAPDSQTSAVDKETAAPEDIIRVYALPVGTEISLTAVEEDLQQIVTAYGADNLPAESFSMTESGKKSSEALAQAGGQTVQYTVTELDAEWAFMVLTLSDAEGGQPECYYFHVDEEHDVQEPVKPVRERVLVRPATAAVLVNGASQAFQAYNIDGSNYFKLRDLAQALENAGQGFAVEWRADIDAILVDTDAAYVSAGGELAGKAAGAAIVAPRNVKLYVDGVRHYLVAYNIGGNNYFKLREIGQLAGFSVDWDQATKQVLINTAQ